MPDTPQTKSRLTKQQREAIKKPLQRFMEAQENLKKHKQKFADEPLPKELADRLDFDQKRDDRVMRERAYEFLGKLWQLPTRNERFMEEAKKWKNLDRGERLERFREFQETEDSRWQTLWDEYMRNRFLDENIMRGEDMVNPEYSIRAWLDAFGKNPLEERQNLEMELWDARRRLPREI